MKTSESIVKIAPALLKSQRETGAAKKDSTNPFFHSKYADLGAVMEACKGPLNNNGITVLQPVVGANVETILIHESGEWMSSETPIVAKSANDPQALGSAISYARRYGLQSMVFIPAEDDDGNVATRNGSQTAAVPAFPDDTGPVASAGKCAICGASGKYHKPGCPNGSK